MLNSSNGIKHENQFIKNYYDNFIQKNPISNFLFLSSTSIVVLIICLLTYMIIFEIDVITFANGKIIPEGKIKTIQPSIGGKILKIYVQEGELVEIGTPLIKLDSTQYERDLNSNSKALDLIERKITRIKTLIQIFKEENFLKLIEDTLITDKGLYNEVCAFKEQIRELNDSLEITITELKLICSQIETSAKNIEYINYKIKNAKKLLTTTVPKSKLVELENKLANLLHESDKYNYLTPVSY